MKVIQIEVTIEWTLRCRCYRMISATVTFYKITLKIIAQQFFKSADDVHHHRYDGRSHSLATLPELSGSISSSSADTPLSRSSEESSPVPRLELCTVEN